MRVFDLRKYEEITRPLRSKHIMELLAKEGHPVDAATISKIKHGKTAPNLKMLVLLADIFKCKIEDFMSDDGKVPVGCNEANSQ